MKNTSELMRMLKASPEKFKDETVSGDIEDESFAAYLRGVMDEQGITAGEMIQRAYVSKTYMYQFLSGERLPGKNTAIRLALSLKLSPDDTQRMLTLAEKPLLYPKIRRDAAILYCLRKGMSLDEANDWLISLEEEPLIPLKD